MRAGGERGAFSSPGTSSPWGDLSHFISLCGAHAGRVIPLSEFSRVPRDSGWEGELRVGGRGWGGISRPLFLQVVCLVTLALSALLQDSRTEGH